MNSISRATLASLLAPCTPSAIIVLVPVISSWSWPFHYELPLLLLTSLAVSYAACFALGLPIINSLRKRRALNTLTLLFTGLIAGVVFGLLAVAGFGLLLGTLRFAFESTSDWAGIVVWGGSYGLATAVVYGLIAGWPENTSKPEPFRGSA
jgi:hypothetical protein